MYKFLTLTALILFGVLGSSLVAEETTILLSYPELQDKIKVSLPDGHDPQKRYPVVFYYAGLGGQPDTELIRFHTGDKDWIVVGMAYINSGKADLSDDPFAKEMKLFHKVKKDVIQKYGGNISQCYAAGFSKGGWLTDAMLQTEPSLAGGIILGAGKMKQFNRMKTYPKNRNSSEKSIFIGIGRNDNNYTYAYHALLMHRKMGAAVNLVIWRDLGHSIPDAGSPSLEQWLSLRLQSKDGLKEVAEKKTQQAFDSIKDLPKLEEYFRLRDLSATPYVKLLGESWKKRIAARIGVLNKDPLVKAESHAHAQKQKALFGELNYRNSADLVKVKQSYLAIKQAYPKSVEATLIDKDISRVEHLLNLVTQREAATQPQSSSSKKEDEPSRKTNKGSIPMNPLIR